MSKTVLFNNDTEFSTPDICLFKQWIDLIIKNQNHDFQVSVEIVNKVTSQQLNKDYRGKDKPTNVLSFPMELPDIVEEKLIGDLAICAEVVEEEAKNKNKNLEHHWAHLCIHGVLHLLGYDHVIDIDAEIMEALEVKLLAQLKIENPYD